MGRFLFLALVLIASCPSVRFCSRSRAFPLRLLFFSLLLVLLLGGSAGAGVPFLFSASSLGAKVAGTPLQAGACAWEHSVLLPLLLPTVLPPFPLVAAGLLSFSPSLSLSLFLFFLASFSVFRSVFRSVFLFSWRCSFLLLSFLLCYVRLLAINSWLSGWLVPCSLLLLPLYLALSLALSVSLSLSFSLPFLVFFLLSLSLSLSSSASLPFRSQSGIRSTGEESVIYGIISWPVTYLRSGAVYLSGKMILVLVF